MTLLAIRRQVELGELRIEALRDEFVMARAPLLRVVVQEANQDEARLVGVDFQFLGGTLAHDCVFHEDGI